MLLLVDNYDSFTYNLYQYLAIGGAPVEVVRNDSKSVDELIALKPRAVVLSPGPGTPDDAGVCLDLIKRLDPSLPLLGVCLGHQALVQAYGGALEVDVAPVHGMASLVHHEGADLLKGLSDPFQAGRYHSLRAVRDKLPEELRLVGWTQDGAVMAVQHLTAPRYGVQFHPESILTPQGQHIVNQFLAIAGFAPAAVQGSQHAR
jgi:anthranilate synthase component 2